MSDFAEILTGYSDPALHVDEEGWDTHIQGFLGWLSVAHPEWNPIPAATGPENSLTLWEDQPNPAEIFEDYGFAYYFMTFLNSQGYDQAFFTAWHHNTENGIEGLNSTLSAAGSSDTFRSLFTDVAVSALVDGFIDNGATVTGADAADLQNDATEATIFWSADAYSTEGAPPWGSDYVPLGAGSSLTSVAFDGDEEFVFPGGPEWVVDADGYWTNPDAPGSTNYESNQDLDITREVTVTGAGLLEFDHYYQTELGWDFGFVQVSTDGGETFTSVACTGTTTDHNAAADPAIASQVPGYTGPDETGDGSVGTAAEPVHATCDLPDAAGAVLLSLRFMTDAGVNFDGWHVKNLTLDGTAVDATPADLSDWNNQAFYSPVALDFIFQIVGLTGTVDQYGDITSAGSVVVLRPTLGAGHTYTLSASDLSALAGSTQVVAIVSGVLDDESTRVYAPYSLVVNGTERADGAGL
jgi:Immune inhibitor A peptidase M6